MKAENIKVLFDFGRVPIPDKRAKKNIKDLGFLEEGEIDISQVNIRKVVFKKGQLIFKVKPKVRSKRG